MQSREIRAGIILNYLSMGLSTVLSILYTPFMLRSLGQNEYGLYQLVFSIVNYLTLLSLGFSSSYVRFYTRYKVKEDKKGLASLNSMYMIIFICISVLSLLIGALLITRIDLIFARSMSREEINIARKLILLLVINIIGTFISSVFNSNITANQKFIFQKVINLIQSILNPILCILALLLGSKSIGLVIVATFLTYAVLLINFWYCKYKLSMQFDFKHSDLTLLKEVAVFSSFILINAVVDQINWSVDKLILGIVTGTVGVAVYGLGAQLNTYYLHFSTAISSVYIPYINEIVARKGSDFELTKIFTRVGKIQFAILTLIISGFIFLGKPFILLWGGCEYTDSYYIALWLMIPATIPLIQNVGIEILRAKNMQGFRTFLYAAIAAGNVVLSIPLCFKYGPLGCAIGTAISLIIGNIFIINIYYHKKVNINIFYFWKRIGRMLPGMIIPGICGSYIYKYAEISRYFLLMKWGVVYCISFGVSIFFFSYTHTERTDIIILLKKIIQKLFHRENSL